MHCRVVISTIRGANNSDDDDDAAAVDAVDRTDAFVRLLCDSKDAVDDSKEDNDDANTSPSVLPELIPVLLELGTHVDDDDFPL